MVTHNLPAQTMPFVGRTHELAEIVALLADPACRLLTLTGPGGIGKTRLALEAARTMPDGEAVPVFPNGLYFVPLQPLSSPDHIVSAVAEAVGFRFYQGAEPQQQLLDYLREKSLLLVLDNFEHLLDGVEIISNLLTHVSRVKILVTSRETLNLQEEWLYQIRGMGFPENEQVKEIENYSAVQLFTQSARRIQADFSPVAEQEAVIRICQLVEGLPLALEMTAAWLKRLPCREIAAEIARGLDILETPARNVSPRHHSMRAVFEQSWKLLTDAERAVLMKLSVFRGGFMRAAAADVAGATLPVLSALVDKSMLRVNHAGRYDIHELLRQYAEEKLVETPGAHDQIHDRHTAYYAEFLYKLEAKLRGSEQIAALDEIEADIDNIRTAWQRASTLRQEQELDKAIEGLALFYMMRSRFIEGERAFRHTLLHLEQVENVLLAKVFLFLARYVIMRGWDQSVELARRGLSLWRTHVLPGEAGFALGLIQPLFGGLFYSDKDSYADQFLQLEKHRTAYRHQGDRWGEAWSLFCLGDLALASKNNEAAYPFLQDSVSIFRSLGSRWAATFPVGGLVRLLTESGQYEAAKELLYEAQATTRTMGDLEGISWNCWQLAEVAYVQGQDKDIQSYVGEALQKAFEIQSYPIWILALSPLIIHLLHRNGAAEQAVELAAFSAAAINHLTHVNVFLDPVYQRVIEQLKHLQTELPAQVFADAKRRGEASDPETLTKDLLDQFWLREPDSATVVVRSQGLDDPLSQRELEVLRLIGEGLTNGEIAARLVIAVGTVKAHTKNIYDKLAVHTRTQAVARARKLKLL